MNIIAPGSVRTRVKAPSRGARYRALIVLNRGLGNDIILAPFLQALERADVFETYFLLSTDVLSQEQIGAELNLTRMRQAPLDPLTRRFQREHHLTLLRYLSDEGINLVLNLRMAAAGSDTDYFTFRRLAATCGIECWDLHEPSAASGSIHERIHALLTSHGVPPLSLNTAWLKPVTKPVAAVKLGCYVGASRGVKRWAPRQWVDVVRQLLDIGYVVEVAAGPVAVEQTLVAEIAGTIQADAFRIAPTHTMARLVDWIAELRLLITNDTGASHLAACMDCLCVTLFLATDGGIWQPAHAPGRYTGLQSATALRCKAMQPDGTCTRLYLGCPARCRDAVTPREVVTSVLSLLEADRPSETGRRESHIDE